MAKKLQPDVIEWILKLNSSQAQEEYHKLEKENKGLKASMAATRKEMVELEKQGKKGSLYVFTEINRNSAPFRMLRFKGFTYDVLIAEKSEGCFICGYRVISDNSISYFSSLPSFIDDSFKSRNEAIVDVFKRLL